MNCGFFLTVGKAYLSINLQDQVLTFIDPKFDGPAAQRAFDAKCLPLVHPFLAGDLGISNQTEGRNRTKFCRQEQLWDSHRTAARKSSHAQKSSFNAQIL